MKIGLDTDSIQSYEQFLKIRKLPSYSISGYQSEFPDEFSEAVLGVRRESPNSRYDPIPGMFDYQRDISRLAIRKRKFCIFAECGRGKTMCMTEFARHCNSVLPPGRAILLISPLMVIDQTLSEASYWYGDELPIERVPSSGLGAWLQSGGRIGITNYEALRKDIPRGRIGALICDESSMLKSHYGHYGREVLRLGQGLDWKLALTGTPAPNDRIEFANHAVFVDAFKTVNEFLARYFINRGQTQNRWELKPHAMAPFYRDISHWCIFLNNPAVYGWKDNTDPLPPIEVSIERVDLTDDQRKAVQAMTGGLFVGKMGGITTRSKLGQIAKGKNGIATNKPGYIRDRIKSWPKESTIVWCKYNDEQARIRDALPDAANIDGNTPHEERMRIIDGFKAGKIKTLISKPRILGFGLNLQVCTRMVFSAMQDSWEEYYQAVKRANRYGSTRPLRVCIPVTEVEEPMVDNVLRKAARIDADTLEQERIFKESRWTF